MAHKPRDYRTLFWIPIQLTCCYWTLQQVIQLGFEWKSQPLRQCSSSCRCLSSPDSIKWIAGLPWNKASLISFSSSAFRLFARVTQPSKFSGSISTLAYWCLFSRLIREGAMPPRKAQDAKPICGSSKSPPWLWEQSNCLSRWLTKRDWISWAGRRFGLTRNHSYPTPPERYGPV